MNPSVIGKPIKKITSDDINNPKILVIDIKDNMPSNMANLCYIDKEDLVNDSTISKDITEEIFSNPRYSISYNDVVPNTFKGLPDLSLLGEEYNDKWIIDFKRNINSEKEDHDGIQEATSYTGRKFMRVGIDGVWQNWQLISSIPFGTITSMILPFDRKTVNHLGWLPLNGQSFLIKKYPELYSVIKNYVLKDEDTFTLPDLDNKYITSTNEESLIGKFKDWTIPSFDEKIGVLSGEDDFASLFREQNDERDSNFLRFERSEPTRIPYLSNSSIENPLNGDGIKENKGLTTYLKLDTKAKFGENHVSSSLIPDTFYVTSFYIYAGYPNV